MKKSKLYSSPYQDEILEASKQKDQIDNEIAYWIAKVTAFFMALGVIYLLFKR